MVAPKQMSSAERHAQENHHRIADTLMESYMTAKAALWALLDEPYSLGSMPTQDEIKNAIASYCTKREAFYFHITKVTK